MSLRKNKHLRFTVLLLAGLLLVQSIAVVFSHVPAQAAEALSYKWDPSSGNNILISGGPLTSTTKVTVSQKPTEAIQGKSIRGVNVNSNVTYTSGWWLWESTYTDPCYLTIDLTFTSESSGTATLSTLASAGTGDGPVSCTAFGSTAVSDYFNNVSFQISGTRLGSSNSEETAEQRGMGIVVYAGEAEKSQTPDTITVVVTGQASYAYNVPRGTYDANDHTYYQWRTDNQWDAGSYHICIESTPSLNLPCQDFTKTKFEKATIVFGQIVTQGETSDERIVQVEVQVEGSYLLCKLWKIDGLVLDLKNEDGTVTKTAQTNSFVNDENVIPPDCNYMNDTYAYGTKYVRTSFSEVAPGNYTICVQNTEICTSFTKEEGKAKIVTLLISGQAGQDILSSAYDPNKRIATTHCSVSNVGWAVCPIITFLSKLADSMFNILADTFLRVGTNVLNQDASKGPTTVFNAWRAMQGIANVVLIIMFLIIVLSQVSNIGISNYGLKRLAPKLVIAAVLINASFILCSLAVDLSNVLGYGIRDFFDKVAQDAVAGFAVSTSILSGQVTDQNSVWATVGGELLAAAGVIAAGPFLLSMLSTLLIAALLVLLLILVILVGRQAIIILAIVLAPVAIALWLLPNTEKITKQWSKIFISMLLVFPIIAILFGASTFVSVILTYAFNTIEGVDGKSSNWLGQIVAAGIQVIPLVATPFILQGVMTSVPVVGKLASRLAQRTNKNLGGKLSDSYNRSAFATARAGRLESRRRFQAQKVAERIRDGGALSKLFTRGVGITNAQKYANDSVARSALLEAEEGESKDIQAEQNSIIAQRIPLESQDGGDMIHELHQAVKGGDTIRARAIQNIMLKTEGGREAYYKAMKRIEDDGDIGAKSKEDGYNAMRTNIQRNFQNMRGTDAALETFANAKSGSLDDAHAQTKFHELTDEELAKQRLQNVQQAGLERNPERARSMLENPTLSGMNQKVRSYLEGIVNSAPGG